MLDRKTIIVVAIFILLSLRYYYLMETKINNITEGFEDKPILSKEEVPSVKFPFKNLLDKDGKKLNIILISAPFRGEEHEKLYLEYKKAGLLFMGISSYSEFPGKLSNPFEDRFHEKKNHDYQAMVRTWLHCFRDPDMYLNSDMPKLLMSESDLKKCPGKPDDNQKKEYDFIYICLKDNDKCTPGWQSHNRNWELAKKCLVIMCQKFNLKGLIVGREGCDFTNTCKNIVKVVPFLKYHEFQNEIKKAKFIFVPNVSDASPRVMTESLCYNLRLLVNYNLVGGWKYVVPETGEFFTSENDIEASIQKLLDNYDNYEPRKWFLENYGREKSGKQLAEFITQHYPDVKPANPSLVTISI